MGSERDERCNGIFENSKSLCSQNFVRKLIGQIKIDNGFWMWMFENSDAEQNYYWNEKAKSNCIGWNVAIRKH